MCNAATDSLAGRTNIDPSGRQVISFTRTLEGLREDVEHLVAHASPDGNPAPGYPSATGGVGHVDAHAAVAVR